MSSVSDSPSAYDEGLFGSDSELHAIRSVATPVLESRAFERLGDISFLGILSPRYRDLVPEHVLASRKRKHTGFDGSRRDHSLGVASLVLQLTRRLSLGEVAERYAVCWALVHDISTWPLSHTCEWGFSKALGLSSRQLRRKLVTGSREIPEAFRLTKPLRECGVDPVRLLALFDAPCSVVSDELGLLWQLIHSPLTPDTLDGIYRAGQVFGIHVPEPQVVCLSISKDLFELSVEATLSSNVLIFWRRKALIYNRIINRPSVVSFESALSLAASSRFADTQLADSLQLSEKEVIAKIQPWLPQPVPDDVHRYKLPSRYFVIPERSRLIKPSVPLRELGRILQRSHTEVSR